MNRLLNRIWVRFGLWIAATVLVTIGILGASVAVFAHYQYKSFYNSLPDKVRREIDLLRMEDQDESPRAVEIYSEYWDGDLLFGESERWALLIGLLVCLPFGLATGFWVSRLVTQPLYSMAEAAKRIALGDFTVRAEPGRKRGEMADMVRDFNHMTDALQQLESERKATAAAVSHELRTPLAVLRARLHAVCDGVIAPDPAEFRTLLDQVEHMGRLVDDLHTLSMADAGRLSLQSVELDLVPLVADALARHADLLAQCGINPELRLHTEAARIHADPDRMRQVVSNLIDNALRHASEGGWLEIGVALDEADDSVVLTVSDAGPGLPEDVRKTLFQRFSRARTANGMPSPKSGSGLGLSIVSALVVRQGGSIAADVSARGGTRFTVRMPAR
ncbi:two-component sensor histidine kinase [Rhodoferax koreense]|uniref:histidine kinase n=1 Tax=Rhodoferax koreensis TaxID=1842727 RepID=A0A1P8JS39_9BURK|nr:ATP-binding protein [Rhodoferax koreense]APW36572.1 two-component sensor histidine kinase [Rhodoferax koreense]